MRTHPLPTHSHAPSAPLTHTLTARHPAVRRPLLASTPEALACRRPSPPPPSPPPSLPRRPRHKARVRARLSPHLEISMPREQRECQSQALPSIAERGAPSRRSPASAGAAEARSAGRDMCAVRGGRTKLQTARQVNDASRPLDHAVSLPHFSSRDPWSEPKRPQRTASTKGALSANAGRHATSTGLLRRQTGYCGDRRADMCTRPKCARRQTNKAAVSRRENQ